MLHQKWVFGLAFAVSAVACAHLPGGFDMSGLLASSGTTNQSSSSSSTVEEEVRVNGKRVDFDDEEDDGRRGKKKAKRSRDRDDEEDEEEEEAPKKKKAKAAGDIGATCHKNDECSARACFVGAGDLGYCTKMCNSWSDCPSHWECKRAGNAPQKICMQDD